MKLKKIIIAVAGVWLLLAVVALVLTSMWGYGEVYYDQIDVDGDGTWDAIKIVDCDPKVKRMSSVPDTIEQLPVTLVAEYAFYGYENLEYITFPGGITQIEEGACGACTGLKEINLPDSLVYIGKEAFASCTSLETISLPAGVQEIGESAFSDCTSLTDVTIYSPDCILFDAPGTLPSCTIHGYAGSTAQAYAEKYGCPFEEIP